MSRPGGTVIGIDLSLTGCGLVAVPGEWDLDWSRVSSITVGEPLARDASPLERVTRLQSLAHVVVRFAERVQATDAWIEAYPIGAGRQLPAVHLLAELGGVVRVRLFEALGIVARAAPISSARKLLLGKLPRSGCKAAVHAALASYGARFATEDESDAFAAANWGLHELGAPCLYREA